MGCPLWGSSAARLNSSIGRCPDGSWPEADGLLTGSGRAEADIQGGAATAPSRSRPMVGICMLANRSRKQPFVLLSTG